jgi:nucleotide-binding universal stress UspA family protein
MEQSTSGELVGAPEVALRRTLSLFYGDDDWRRRHIVEGASVAETILVQAQASDLVVIGATAEPLFKNLLVGNIPERVAREAPVTVIVVKRRNSRLHAFLRRTVLPPSSAADGLNPLRNRI